MSDKFASILDRPATAFERPKPLPPGTYLCIVQGLPRYDKSAKKQTPFVEFTLQPTAPAKDVDDEALAAMGGLANKTIKSTYYLTEEAAWRLTKFLGDLGFDVNNEEGLDEEDLPKVRQMCEEATNSQVYVTLKHRSSEDGKSIFAEVADTARVD